MNSVMRHWKALAAALLLAACGGGSQQGSTYAADPTTAEQSEVAVSHDEPAAAKQPQPARPPSDSAATPAEGVTPPGTTEEPAAPAAKTDALRATAEVKSIAGGKSLGTMTFEQVGNTVTINGTFTGLKAGMRGIHIHEKGDCGNGGKNAGAHFNPSKQKHGPPESGTRHSGDFGNLTVDEGGNATFTMTTDSITVAEGPDSIVGRAVVIHAKKDDGKSQPSGNAGAPMACGVIEKQGDAPVGMIK